MNILGNGLYDARYYVDSLSVKEAELSTMKRVGISGEHILAVQSNLSNAYQGLGRHEEAMRMRQIVYSGFLKLYGEESERTFQAALNCAISLGDLRRFEEAKSLLRKTVPVAQRVYSESHEITLKMRSVYARSLFEDNGATLDDLREVVTTLEETERTARRVLGGAHPLTTKIEHDLRKTRAALRAREAPPSSSGGA